MVCQLRPADLTRSVELDDEGVGAHIAAAMVAGAASTMATSPIWVVRTRFQVRHRHLDAADSADASARYAA